MGPHHGYLFIGKAKGQITKISIHELLHGLGFAMPCTKGVRDGAHLGTGILSHELSPKFGKAVYEHKDPTCPDLKDSVYLTPTSDDAYDPLPMVCHLAERAGRAHGDSYGFENQWPEKYNHKKFKKIKKKSYWCTYKLAEFAKDDWFRKWK